ncbi:MAG: hypothetical protein ACD_32C00101G0001 [uncultured bacterium]|jgi:hypothetical protein|nr:MAG: hypothetical protein ACD_32C00101G0001 [uncultured bacterium]
MMDGDTKKKWIEPVEGKADMVAWIYEEIAKDIHNVQTIYNLAKKRGYKSAKSLFWWIIRNPLYCGKVFVPKYKEEEAKFVQGQHKPIISEDLFYRVQDILDGKKQVKYKTNPGCKESAPLRGYLICPKCNRILTASESKGRHKYYAYYHCTDGCPTRFSAQNINDQFVDRLRDYIPKKEIEPIYAAVLKQSWVKKIGNRKEERNKIEKEIADLKARLLYIADLLTSQEIEPSEYREMKANYQNKLDRLKVDLSVAVDSEEDIKPILK